MNLAHINQIKNKNKNNNKITDYTLATLMYILNIYIFF